MVVNLWVTSLSHAARRHLRGLLQEAGLATIAEPASITALQRALAAQPDDIVVSGIEWNDARPFVRAARDCEVPVLVLVRPDEPVDGHPAMVAGADAILHSDASPSVVRAAVDALGAGLRVFGERSDGRPHFRAGFMAERGQPASQADEAGVHRTDGARPLSLRERQILELVAAGTSNKRIARELRVSPNTVKFHLASLFDKLGATTRAEAVAVAIRRGELVL
jgi:DNA-binding NarL/FixJ family response regulator